MRANGIDNIHNRTRIGRCGFCHVRIGLCDFCLDKRRNTINFYELFQPMFVVAIDVTPGNDGFIVFCDLKSVELVAKLSARVAVFSDKTKSTYRYFLRI